MEINNLNLNRNMPIRFSSSGLESSNAGKMRIKTFRQLSNDAIFTKSDLKARKEVQNSGKMKLLKAMPSITATIVGTSLAITQPGKLSAKAGAGLGILLYTGICEQLSRFIPRKAPSDNKKKEIAKFLVKATGLIAGTFALIKNAPKIADYFAKSNNKAVVFLRNEASKFANEVDSSKLGKFVQEKVVPFEQKHWEKLEIASLFGILGFVNLSALIQKGLVKSLHKHYDKKCFQHYSNSLEIQKIAREEFDKIDAIEV